MAEPSEPEVNNLVTINPPDRWQHFRDTYAGMSDELLMRERAACITALQEAEARVKLDGPKNKQDINLIKGLVFDEVKARLARGEWQEIPMPVPAAFIAINNKVIGLEGDAEIIAITMRRRSTWDGITNEVAFVCTVWSSRNFPEPMHMTHEGVVRCQNGQVWGHLGRGEYDLTEAEARDEYTRLARVLPH